MSQKLSKDGDVLEYKFFRLNSILNYSRLFKICLLYNNNG